MVLNMKNNFNKKFFENLSGNKNTTNEEKPSPVVQDWFSSSEAAEYLRIPVGSLRNLVSNGVLRPSGKIGRLNRFHINDLIELLTRK